MVQDEPAETRPMIFPSADEVAILHQLSLAGNINQLRARLAKAESYLQAIRTDINPSNIIKLIIG